MFTFYGKVDVTSILEKLSDLDWDEYDFRQRAFRVPLLWNEVPDHEKIVEHTHFKKFEADLFEIQALQLPPGEIHTAILIKLPAGASIPTHRDAAPHFKLYRRIHLPIVTNPKCLFTVGNQTIHMKAGELWEIDNDTQPHSVVNGGSEDRVHLLIDYFVFPK
jgi:quercetin dioxygenase-like cupin family protein